MSKHNLYSDALNLAPVDFDFGEGYGDRWEVVYPDVDDWTIEKCRAYLDDQGVDLPDPNPYLAHDAYRLAEMAVELGIEGFEEIEDEYGCGDYSIPDEYKTGVGLTTVKLDAVRDRIIEEINNETADGIEDWRSAVRDHMQDDGADAFAPMMNYYYPLPNLGIPPEAAQERVMDTACVIALIDGEPVLALAGGGMDLSPDICKAYVALGYYPPMHFASGLPRLGAAYREITPELVDICVEGAEIALRRAQNNLDDLRRFADELAARTA